MIVQERDRLVWGDEDRLPMARILGSDAARKRWVPIIPSVLKAADSEGVILHPELEERLKFERNLRDEIRPTRRRKDVDPSELEHLYPRRLLKRLFPHQRVALAYMVHFDQYLLADQPGVGKTPPSIMWMNRRVDEGKILVVTPGTAREQWRRAIRRWARTKDINVVEGRIPEQEEIIGSDARWIVSHWEALVNCRDAFLDVDWSGVILDESQAIKNRETKRAETAFAMAEASFKLCLSGHPYTKTPDELYSQLRFLRPDIYTSYWRFFSMHVEAIQSYFGGMDIVGARQPKLLRWEIAPFVLRRTKRKVFKSLPTIVRQARYVEMSKKATNEYKRLKKEIFVELEGRDRLLPIINPLARTTRLRQFLVDPGLLDSTSPAVKYPVVLELLDELDGPPVIFTTFAQAAKRLETYLIKKGKTVGMLIGGTGRSKKARAKEKKVQRDFLRGKMDALIITTQKGGSALNLGKYGYVIFLDLPATFKDLEQCEGRVDRPEEGTGKIVPTTSIRIIIRNTYEEKIQEKRLRKRKLMFDQVFTQGQFEDLF